MPNRRQALGAETELSHAEIAAIAHGHCITARVVADDKAKRYADYWNRRYTSGDLLQA